MLAQRDKVDLLLQADALLDGGTLPEARTLYVRINQLDPGDVESWLMRAAIEAELGAAEPAMACCKQVIGLDPKNAEAHSMQGRLLANQGRLTGAQAALAESVRLDPTDGETWNALAGVLLKQGLFADAERCGRETIRLRPLAGEGYINLGNALAGLGRLDDAIAACTKAVALDERNGLAWGSLALIYERAEEWPNAINAYVKLLELLPQQLSGMTGLVRVYCALEQLDEAERLLTQTLESYPADAEAHRMQGKLYAGKGNMQQAEFHYRQAARLNTTSVGAWVDLGNLLQEQQRYEEAEDCYRQALGTSGTHPDVYFNWGVCHQRQGRFKTALDHFERAIAYRPDFVEAHWYKSFVCLLTGDYEQGWNEYEWRLRQKQNIPRPFSQPIWDGSSLSGRTILVHDEQGYGDTFQFVRYLPLVKARGGRVILECHSKLAAVLKGCKGYDEIIERTSLDGVPEIVFDTQIHLLSLPKIFQTRLESIPADEPYIDADPLRVEYWRDRVANDPNFKVGIAWAGSSHHTNELNRSCSLTTFQSVAALPGVSVYSLQKGPGSEQADALLAGMEIIRIDKEMDLTERFVDTAALMASLDLVISIDTSIVHLAGALGCPVWTLLCASPDWRWLQQETHTAWYPTMRIFRQSKSGDWDEVMARVSVALELLIQQKGH